MTLDLRRGELLAVVGENGAGKSSLMNVLYGLYQPDAGQLLVEGKPVAMRGPGDAIRRGIGMVHQHFMLVPPLTVAENVVLGREPTRRGLLDMETACAQVEDTCRRFGFTLDPRVRVEELSVGSQQKVEIVKALHRGAQVLVLDEPTAVLTPQEATELYAVARRLVKDGHSVVLISHKLREVLGVADRIAVLRRGRMVAEVRPAETTAEALAELMVGGATLPGTGSILPVPAAGATAVRSDILVVTDLVARRGDGTVALDRVSLQVRAGEIVGIAGVDGNGQRELAEVLTGLRAAASGQLTLLGEDVLGLPPAALRARGVGHVPEDRLLRAVVGPMSVEENASLGRHRSPPFVRGPGSALIDFTGRRAQVTSLLEAYDVRPRDPTLRIAELSGGNQQKVVMGRELEARPKLLVVVQPTRGLDVAAVAGIHARLRAHRDTGAGILLVSLDLEEVLALSDRAYVMFGGRITGERDREAFDEAELGRMMLGAVHGAA